MTTCEQTDVARVVIVDDHQLVREGLTHRLDALPHLEVVGEAGTVASAIDQISLLKPDIAVLDVGLPDGSGLDLCQQVTTLSPATRRVIRAGTVVDRLVAARAGAAAIEQAVASSSRSMP